MLNYIFESGVESDAGESKDEAPVFVLIENFVDSTYLVASEDGLDDEGCDKGSNEETDDEFRETGPNLAGSDFLAAAFIDMGCEIDCDEECDEADKDILDHLDEDGCLFAITSEDGSCNSNCTGTVDGTSDQRTTHDGGHSYGLDDNRLENHHKDCENNRNGNDHGEVCLFAIGGSASGNCCTGTADAGSRCHGDDKRFIINPDYIKAITGVYNAQVSNLDFGTSKATQQINDWIKQQSGGEFDNIVKETHPNEIIYLVNYLKFKALWENPFDKKFTFDHEFTNDDGTTTIVPSMFRYFRELYYEDNTCQVVSMKYDNSEFRMLVVLPKNSKIDKFLMSMSASEFSRIVSGLKAPGMVVDLRLPRFSTDCNLNLRDMLATLMPTAFNDNADFSRLSKEHSYINRFTQDTKIEVKEFGTEASSVTVQSNMFKSINLPFNATHPFLYFIYDETTHAILQAGQFCGDGFKTSDDGIFNSCAQMPHFPGGDGALMRFINDNLKYPPEAFENRIEGKVIIQFVVTKTGKVGQVRVARAVNRYLDREAIRLCKMLPDFTPGRNALGEPVSVWYTLPVSFKLPNNN